jgi:hypothetical protein
VITASDDLRHVPGTEENYSESKWFSFYDETNDIWVSSRMGLEPNKNKANRWLVAAVQGKIIINDLNGDLELPEENWNNIAAGGLEYSTRKPMSEYGIKFNLGDISADIHWEALTPVFDYKDCYAPMPPSLAAEHYEQSGKISGTMRVSGTHYKVGGTGHRDHSWGVRHWEGFRSWVAFMGHFGPDYFFHLEQFHEQSTGLSWHGFIYRDGENLAVKHVHMEPAYSGGEQFPNQFKVNLEDVKGGAADIMGNFRSGAPLAFGNCQVMESFGTFSLGSKTTAGVIEYGSTQNFKGE